MNPKWIKIIDRDGFECRIRSDRISAYCGRINDKNQYEVEFVLFGLNVPYSVTVEDDDRMEELLKQISNDLL